MFENILYVGGFMLPDKNAAAQRVIANAAAFRSMGHSVFFINHSEDCTQEGWTHYFDFPCFECIRHGIVSYLKSMFLIKRIITEKNITTIIAYNYLSIALKQLMDYCKKNSINCFADVTEWYEPRGNLIFKLIKKIDTEYRMRILHPKTDGIIAISRYLLEYYRNKVKTVEIPPLIDIDQCKWHNLNKVTNELDKETTLIFCGSPSQKKERLDLVIDAIESIPNRISVCLRIIGITKEEYENLYYTKYHGKRVSFYGRISHIDSLKLISESDWSIIIRDNNKVVRAGFPTKLVESITCGTPVIINDFSNIKDYVNEKNGIICDKDNIKESIECACNTRISTNTRQFDFHNYIGEFSKLLIRENVLLM